MTCCRWLAFACSLFLLPVDLGANAEAMASTNRQGEGAQLEAARQKIVDDLRSYDLSLPEQCEALIARARATRDGETGWSCGPHRAEIITRIRGAQEHLRILQEQKIVRRAIEGMTKELDGKPNPDALETTFRKIREAKPEAEAAGVDFVTQLDELRRKCNSTYFDALRARATVESATAKQGRDLAAHGKLEDLLLVLIGEAQLEKDAEEISRWHKAYTEIFRETNGIVASLFTDEYQKGVPWGDMLEDAAAWTDGGAKTNLEFAVTPAGLTLNLAKDGQARIAGIYFDPAQDWRDYVVEMEVKLDSGMATFYARASSPDEAKAVLDTQKVSGFSMGTEKVNIKVEHGKSVTVVANVIGEQFSVRVDGAQVMSETIKKNKARRGYFAISCKAGTSLTVSRLRCRLLR